MSEFKFSDNYSDLCIQEGVNAGFQFEFFCERCGDTFRSKFDPWSTGQGAGWLGRAAGMFGGVLGQVGDAADGLAQSGWGKARDKAFQEAIEEAKEHFNRCPRCSNYFCDRCWNSEAGLCLICAPSAEVEIEAARASGAVFGVGEKAALEGIREGKKMDVKRRRQLVCPQCGAETEGAKFCPGCGQQLAVKAACPACSAEVSASAKFCPECGEKL